LTEGDWTYIRNERDDHEELFHLGQDAQEQHDLAQDRAMKPRLEQMKKALRRLADGPLTPRRFNY
jgi:hypothetical protein